MENRTDILELVIDHELAVGKLYEAYADIFPGHREFWNSLAAEEHRHASQLESLRSVPDLNVWFSRCQFKPQALVLSMDYINGLMSKARKESPSLVKALSCARDIENALIEKLFSRIDSAVPYQLANVLAVLARETEKHRKLISEALAENR